ncbi:hypothetical protein GCM10027435_10240 [Haloparvum alkalitolerans]|uniref:DUF7533 family protein n=1 Tax=Haloparvum alkalitolerans TaxID=1042953 RepID=UPI003CE8A832
MKFGLLDMIGLAATMAFALPVGNYGLMRLLEGETALGAAMVVVAVAMVVLPQFFFDPARIARGLLAGLLPARFRSDADEAEPGSDPVEK